MIKIWIMIVSFIFSFANPSVKTEIKTGQPDIERAVVFFNRATMVDKEIDLPFNRISTVHFTATEKGYRHFRRVWIGEYEPKPYYIHGVPGTDSYELYDTREYRFKIMADLYKLFVIPVDI